jgi:hypothetical protein
VGTQGGQACVEGVQGTSADLTRNANVRILSSALSELPKAHDGCEHSMYAVIMTHHFIGRRFTIYDLPLAVTGGNR